jgi:hypothetical protein
MLNTKKSYLQINPGDPKFFYDLVSWKGPPSVVNFLNEITGALIGNLGALCFVFVSLHRKDLTRLVVNYSCLDLC